MLNDLDFDRKITVILVCIIVLVQGWKNQIWVNQEG